MHFQIGKTVLKAYKNYTSIIKHIGKHADQIYLMCELKKDLYSSTAVHGMHMSLLVYTNIPLHIHIC